MSEINTVTAMIVSLIAILTALALSTQAIDEMLNQQRDIGRVIGRFLVIIVIAGIGIRSSDVVQWFIGLFGGAGG
jgi:hypothetical protein